MAIWERDPSLRNKERFEATPTDAWEAVSGAVFEGVFEEIDTAGQDVANIAAQQGFGPAAAHAGIRTAGTAGMIAGNVLEVPFEGAAKAVSAVTPPFIKTEYNALMGSISEGITDSESFKWAMNQAKENPQKAKELVSMLRTLDVTGVRHMGGPVVNDLLENVITKLEGFYDSPAGAVTAFAREGTKAVPNTVKEQFSPQAAADKRVLGTGATRRNEAVNAPTGSERQGNKYATTFIRKQIDDRLDDETISDMLPSIQVGNYGVTRWGDQQGVRNLLTMDGEVDVPPQVVDWFVDSTQRGLDPKTNFRNPLNILKNEVIPRVTNFRNDVDQTLLNVRNPNSKVDNLAEEALGATSTGSALQRNLRNNGYEKFLKQTGFNDTFDAFVDYVNLSHAFENTGWDKLPARLRDENGRSELLTKYVNAKYNRDPAKWNDNQREIVESVDNVLKMGTPESKGWVDFDNQTIKYSTSYRSSAKDLGGVGFRGLYDYGNGKSYTSVIDGHDMFGTNPAGGVGLWNSTPIMSANLTGHTPLPKRTTGDTEKLEEATKALEERTGMMRYPKESAEEYFERIGEPRLTQPSGRPETVKQYEKRTGTKQRIKDESPGLFEGRVMRDYVAPVTMSDRAKVAGNYGLLTSSMADFETTAGGLPPYLLNQQAKDGFDELRGLIGNVTGKSASQIFSKEQQ